MKKITKGLYKDGLKHGYGELYLAEGGYMKCQWRKGKQHGEGVIKVENEDFEQRASWIDGEMIQD